MAEPPSKDDLDDRYTIDDLVADERRHLKFMIVIFVLAAIYFAVYGRPKIFTPKPERPGASGR